MAQSLTIQAGEVGKTLTDVPGISLTGFTVNLLVQDTSGNLKSYAMTILGDNKTVQYTTLGTEFPTAGTYKIQLELLSGSDKFYTAVGNVKVMSNLA